MNFWFPDCNKPFFNVTKFSVFTIIKYFRVKTIRTSEKKIYKKDEKCYFFVKIKLENLKYCYKTQKNKNKYWNIYENSVLFYHKKHVILIIIMLKKENGRKLC
ncbi:hypothetical protein COJ55_12490 [Bacillus cereus]|nr:hypothetical protein COJ55_12490 [Bacillus cereus]